MRSLKKPCQPSGCKHRLQYVDEIQGVKFYNDSKSTNILATQKALSGFDNNKVILIAGGSIVAMNLMNWYPPLLV